MNDRTNERTNERTIKLRGKGKKDASRKEGEEWKEGRKGRREEG